MRARRGTTLLELLVAGVLLVALMSACLELLLAAGAMRRAVEERQTALEEAANVMERLSARPFDELSPEAVRGAQLSAPARARLPAGAVEIQLADAPDGPAAKRITVIVRWQASGGRSELTARLVAWRYR
jgi:Tfp pilus assembly protein PilV